MNRVAPENMKLLIEFLEFSKRLPLDIIAVTSHANRDDAARSGALKYFTGGLCRHGHMSDRWTSSGGCIECSPQVKLAAATRDAPPPASYSGPAIPPCLLITRVAPAPCMKCPRHYTHECKGIQATNLLRRAQLSYPDFPPVGRADALRQGSTLYMPSEPCKACGVRVWRSVANGVCAECNLRARNARRGFTGHADTSTISQARAAINVLIADHIDPDDAAQLAADDARIADMRRRNA